MSKWILEESENKKENFVLTKPQKYSVIKTFYASSDFDMEKKEALSKIVLSEDTSDEGQNCANYCKMVLPDAE